jgi:transposase InsO family protein
MHYYFLAIAELLGLLIVHIDHTQLDLELRSSATGRLLGRPWATLLMDAYSRRILAVYLTFDAPSYRSCMMALRLCVSRFGRFPQTVVVDGGSEFHSVYFDTLLARYGCIKKTRPGGQSRFGSVIERLFGTTNTELIFNLLGNTHSGFHLDGTNHSGVCLSGYSSEYATHVKTAIKRLSRFANSLRRLTQSGKPCGR